MAGFDDLIASVVIATAPKGSAVGDRFDITLQQGAKAMGVVSALSQKGVSLGDKLGEDGKVTAYAEGRPHSLILDVLGVPESKISRL